MAAPLSLVLLFRLLLGPLGFAGASRNPKQTINPLMWLRGAFWSLSGAYWDPKQTINPLMWPRGGSLGASWGLLGSPGTWTRLYIL